MPQVLFFREDDGTCPFLEWFEALHGHLRGGRRIMKPRKKGTRDGVEILHRRYYAGRPDRIESLEEERTHAALARELYDLRQEAGLTQEQLATRMGTEKSVISRLESADYEGHSLPTLKRVSEALGYELEVRFVSTQRGKKRTSYDSFKRDQPAAKSATVSCTQSALHVPRKFVPAWKMRRVSGKLDGPPGERIVRAAVLEILAQLLADDKSVIGVDADIAAIEQSMDIAPQQESVGHVVGAVFSVGPNVCSFERR